MTPKLGHLIYTYNRITYCRINQELSRELFGNIPLIHAYNGEEEFGYTKYLEDYLIRLSNRGHFKGAVDLINAGITKAEELDIDYLLITASDTWFIDNKFITNLLSQMQNEGKKIAASSWNTPDLQPINAAGLSVDLFVIDLAWQKQVKLFPLKYDEYLDKYLPISYAIGDKTMLTPEKCVSYQLLMYLSSIYQDNDIYYKLHEWVREIDERYPIHQKNLRRNVEFPNIGLYTYHDQTKQKELLKEISRKINLGPYAQKLIQE